MACFHPLHGYKSKSLTAAGKRAVVFNLKDGYRDLPVTVPCGSCVGCRSDRVKDWMIRLDHESLFHEQSAFLTLTYDDDHLPSDGGLVKAHLQGFMKRLRSDFSPAKLRFFACGEYGEQGSRPHYHVILFGADFREDRVKHVTSAEYPVYSSERLSRLWGMGHCSIGAVSSASCHYTAAYIFKKITGEGADSHYSHLNLATGEIYSRIPEFVVMSRRPGIGSAFYDRFRSDLNDDFVVIGGVKAAVPPFYDSRVGRDSPELLKRIKRKRVRQAAKRAADNTPERLAVRKAVFLAKRALGSGRKL